MVGLSGGVEIGCAGVGFCKARGLLARLYGSVLVGAGPGVCSLVIVNQVLVRFWARRTSRVAFGLVRACCVLGSGVVWGCPWFGWHGCLTQAVVLRDIMTECRLGCSGQRRFMCVLSMMDM